MSVRAYTRSPHNIVYVFRENEIETLARAHDEIENR